MRDAGLCLALRLPPHLTAPLLARRSARGAISSPVDADNASGADGDGASNGGEFFGIDTDPLVWDDPSTLGGDSTTEAP